MDVSHNEYILLSYFAIAKHSRNSTYTAPLNKHFPNLFTVRLDVFCSYTWKAQILIYATPEFWRDLIKTKLFLTVSILTLKGKLNGEILLLRFFLSGICLQLISFKVKKNFPTFYWLQTSKTTLQSLFHRKR